MMFFAVSFEVKHLGPRSVWGAWKNSNRLVRDQVNMVGVEYFHNQFRFISEVLQSQHASGHYPEKELKLSIDVNATISDAFRWFAILFSSNRFPWILEIIMNQSSQRPPNFWWNLGFGKDFTVSSWSNHWHELPDCHTWFISCLKSQFDRVVVHFYCARREKTTPVNADFWFSFWSWGIHLTSFPTFPICFRFRAIVEKSTFNFFCSFARVGFNYWSELIIINKR